MERGNRSASKELKTIGRVFSTALQQAKQSENIVLARRRFPEILETKGPGNRGIVLEGTAGDAGEKKTPREEERSHYSSDQGRLGDPIPGDR